MTDSLLTNSTAQCSSPQDAAHSAFTVLGLNEFQLPVLDWGGGIQTTVNEAMFGRGRLVVCRYPNVWMLPKGVEGDADNHGLSFACDDGWCYDSLTAAVVELASWNPHETPMPDHWRKHVNGGRYRINGDARYEYGTYEEEQEVRARFLLDQKQEQ